MTIRFLISPIFFFTSAMLSILMGFPGNKAVAYNSQFSANVPLELDSKDRLSPKAIALGLAKEDEAKSISDEKPIKDSIRNNEYIFRAPQQNTSQQTTSQLKTTTYQVQVYGNSENLLSKVKAIEPKAFLKGNLIQVGNFSTQENAEQLLKKLAIEGLWARIMVLS